MRKSNISNNDFILYLYNQLHYSNFNCQNFNFTHLNKYNIIALISIVDNNSNRNIKHKTLN